jgi:hypothetical protein
MAKKVNQTFTAHLIKNTLTEKGGAWLLDIFVTNENAPIVVYNDKTAWANPSAAKRYLKTIVLEMTPRKNIKMGVVTTNESGKPVHLGGQLTYKVDA